MQEPKEVQFNIENTTTQPVTIDLFDASSLTPISSSSNFSTSSSPSNLSGGGNIEYMVYDSVSNLINITRSNSTLTFFNPVTQSFSNGLVINNNLPYSYNFTPTQPTSTASNGYIYCADDDTNVVRVIDPTTYKIIDSIVTNSFTEYSLFVSYNQKAYFTYLNQQRVYVIDTITNTLEATLDLSTLPNITDLGSITFNSINNQLYISPYNGGYYTYIIDVDTNTFSESDLGVANQRTNSIVFNPTNNCLYFETNDFSVTNISVFDCNTNSFVTNIEIVNYISTNQFDNGVYCPVNNSIYFYNIGTDSIYVIDCSTNTLIDTIPITSTDNLSYGIVYSSIDNSVYIQTASSTFNNFDGLQKIDCSTNTLSSVSISTQSENLSNSAQSTLNGDIYIYSETENIVSVFSSTGTFITNIPNIGTAGAGNRSGIIYIEFFNCVIVNTDAGLEIINCVNNTANVEINNTYVANKTYELIYDEFTGLLYVILKDSPYTIFKYYFQGYGTGQPVLNQNTITPVNSATLSLKNQNIYSNFNNKNFLNIVDNSLVQLVRFSVGNGNLYGQQLGQNIFSYNISNSNFNGNIYLAEYSNLNNVTQSFVFSEYNSKLYAIVWFNTISAYYLYEINSSTLQIERTFNLSSLNYTEIFLDLLVISNDTLIINSENYIFKFNITSFTNESIVDLSSLGYNTPSNYLSYSTQDSKVFVTTTNSYFFIDINTFLPSSENVIGVGLLQTIYISSYNQFYSVSTSNEVYVIDSNTESVVTNIPIVNGYTFANISYCPINNLIYVGGYFVPNGTIDYIDPNTNTVIFTDTLTELNEVMSIAYDSSTNSMFLGGTSSSNSNILNYTCVNPLSETPVKTQIVTQSKTIDNYYISTNNQGISTSSLNGYTYISSQSENCISVFNELNQLVTEITIPYPYNSIFVESLNYLYVIQPNNTTTDISIIDCSTNTILTTTTLPDYPFDLLYSSIDNKIYVTCSNNLIRLENDLSSYTQYAYSSSVTNSGIALNTQDNLIYVSGVAFNNTIFVFNCNTLTFNPDIVIFDDGISNPSITYNQTNNCLYTFDSNSVSVIDCVSNTLLKSVSFIGTTSISQINTKSSALTSDNMLVFSSVDEDFVVYLVFFDCNINEVSYSRYVESVSSGNNLKSNKNIGFVGGISFNTFDNSLRVFSGQNGFSNQYDNIQTLLSISLQQTNYNVLTISSNQTINLGDNDTQFVVGLGTNGGDTKTSFVLPNGSIYYGGLFSEWNGYTCGNIARVLNNGSYDTSFIQGTGFSSQVNVIKIQSDNKVICGGNFISYNGTSISCIARLNTNGSLDTTFNQGTGFNTEVRDLIVLSNDKIIVAGDFVNYNGNTCNYIARLNSDGSFDSTFNIGTGFNGYVSTISIQSDGKIICGGGFTSYNGNACNYIARLNSDGSFDSTFNIGTGFDNSVLKVFVKVDDKILVSGTFTDFDGNLLYNYVQLNSDGSFDSYFYVDSTVGNIDNPIFDIYSNENGLIYFVGSFTQFNFNSRDGIVVLNPTGYINNFFDYTSITTGVKLSISSNSLSLNDKVYISGTAINDVIYNSYTNESYLDINEYQELSNNFDTFGYVNNIINNNQKVLVLGQFSTYLNTYAVNGMVQFNLDGTIDTNFNNFLFGVGSQIECSFIQLDGKILLGGFFTSYDGNTISNILRINSDGSYDSTFNTSAGFNGGVLSIDLQSDGKIICVGGFTDFNGNTCFRIVRLNTDGSYDSSFITGAGFNNSVNTVYVDSDDSIICGGQFTDFDGNVVGYITRLNSDGSFDSSFNISFDNACLLIKNINSKLYFAGEFVVANISSTSFNVFRILRLNSDFSFDSSFSTSNISGLGFNSSVNVITQLSDGNLFVGGNFGAYMGINSQRGIIIDSYGSIVSVKSTNGFNNDVNTAIEINGKIYVGGDFSDYSNKNCTYFVIIDYSQNIINTLNNIDLISTTFPVISPYSFSTYNTNFSLMYYNILNSYLYVSLFNNNNLLVLDANNNYSLISSVSLPIGSNVSSFALNPENNILAIGTSTYQNFGTYVVPNYGIPVNGGLIMLNAQTNTINQTLSTLNNSGVLFLTYSPVSGNFVYGGIFYSNSTTTYISFATPSSSFTISGGSVNYNFFVQSLNNDPKKIEQIELVMPQTYLANPVNVQYTDASGISNLNPFLPNIEIDTFQKATNRAKVKFGDEYIMNINTKIVDFVLPPLSTTVLVITYQELLKSDMLDAVVYADELKAKYKINQDANSGVITAEKYWGAKKMPKKLSLGKDWLADMKQKFSKVELLEYDLPKLAGGTATTRQVYADLFGFKKQVKKKNISILKTKKKKVRYKKNVDIKLATKKQKIKEKQKPKSSLEIFTDLIKSTIKSKNVEVKQIKNSDFKTKKGVLLGVKDKNSNHSIYLVKPNADRFTAVRFIGDTDVKIELKSDWLKDISSKFNEVMILELNKR